MEALSIVERSLRIKETMENRGIFVACVRRARFADCPDSVKATLVRALSEPWGRPGDLHRVATDVVKLNRDIGDSIARAAGAWPQRLPAPALFGPTGFAAVAADPLLGALLDSAPICDIALERFLTMVRRAMLDAAIEATAQETVDAASVGFYSSLARQCYINEYVFALADDEAEQARALRDALVAALEADAQIPVLWLVTTAAYFPLHSVSLSDRVLDRPWPDTVIAVLTQQIREPEEERQYRATIPQLTAIEDNVSLLVQGQYEENPYPRWVKAAPVGKPLPIDEFLRRRFPLVPFLPLGKRSDLDILIGGCGTGQHSTETAQQFQGARVLAVDLSMTSLCYAKRKTRELGLPMIEYAQADFLKLETLGRSFDLIESSGALVCVADPMAGWRRLLSLLRPGGFMRLGLYSVVARRDVVRARAFIAERGYGSTAEDIRRCRQDMMSLDEAAGFGTALRFQDFFSISACRDLLFHVQEHRMTLGDIETFLTENALRFLGFDLPADVLPAYRQRFPSDPAATNLANWQDFERDNPDIFLSMYQFWIQNAR